MLRVTTSTARPPSVWVRSSSMTDLSMPGSSPEVGSSSSSGSGRVSGSRATETHLRWAARDTADERVGVLGRPEVADDAVDLVLADLRVVVGRQAQLRRVAQGPADGEPTVHDIVLGDDADALAQAGEVLVELDAAVDDAAIRGRSGAGDGAQQRRLAGA